MKTTAAVLTFATLVLAASAGWADVLYTQDFNGMGTGTTAPSGWSVYSISGSHDQFKPADDTLGTGAFPTGNDIKGGTLQSTLIAGTPGSQKSSQGYNWAVGGSSSERSLGSSPTGIAGMVLQLALTNTTGAPITDIAIDYDIRCFSTTTNNNTGYDSGPYKGIEELPGYQLFYSLDGGATYTNVSALNTDGHTWANAVGTVHESLADLSLGGSWAPGAALYFRWLDDNAQSPSPDQLVGLDNVSLQTVPEPASMLLLGTGAFGLLGVVRRRMMR